ncbi:hypothetical protein PSET11_03052 [Arthrobacter ulcerisalmonis]|uniref:Recombinase n=1 Tax=Arthrobacter ulcerisalmonis TaxID=2483813 RepID=A0A3P5XC68_9MICC|nr:hypothetical protein PSET11_03052 [Arthrobacter ulcerisalmonis]
MYLRISADKGIRLGEEGLAVDRQRADINKMLARKGWTAGKEYLENDTSASGKVPRPQYAQMLKDFEAGEIDAIAAWDLDRLWRVPMEFEHLLAMVDQQGLMLATVGGDADLSTDNGILYARIKVAVAADELKKRAARQRAKFAQDREAGKDHWRGRRPFGLTLEGKEIKEEADAIRWVAEFIIDGGTISDAVRELNDRKVATSFGNTWARGPLRTILLKPRVAGLMEHNVVRDKDGKKVSFDLVPGNWDAILDLDTWKAVCAVLKTPGRGQAKRTDKEYLCSGLITCSECKEPVYGTYSPRKLKSGVENQRWIYRCQHQHISKVMDKVDDLVIMNTLLEFASLDTAEIVADKEALRGLRASRALEEKDWTDWMKEAARDKMRPSDIRPFRDAHDARMAELDQKIREFEKVSLVRVPTPEEEADNVAVVFEWDAMPLAKRRRMIETVFESITFLPSKKGARWRPELVVFKKRYA